MEKLKDWHPTRPSNHQTCDLGELNWFEALSTSKVGKEMVVSCPIQASLWALKHCLGQARIIVSPSTADVWLSVVIENNIILDVISLWFDTSLFGFGLSYARISQERCHHLASCVEYSVLIGPSPACNGWIWTVQAQKIGPCWICGLTLIGCDQISDIDNTNSALNELVYGRTEDINNILLPCGFIYHGPPQNQGIYTIVRVIESLQW